MSGSKRLRVLVVGGTGLLGRAVVATLGARHEIVTAGSKSGDIRINVVDPASIQAGLQQAGRLDAICCTAGRVNFVPLAEIKPAALPESTYALGLADKLMGQVNLTLAARDHLPDGGSITLISGILADAPIAAGSSASMVNKALEGFVRTAACELTRGLRLNLVSPTVFTEALDAYGPFFRGFPPVPVSAAAEAYSRSVEGIETGQIYRVG